MVNDHLERNLLPPNHGLPVYIHHLTDMVIYSTVLFASVLKDGQMFMCILFCVEGTCVSVNVCMWYWYVYDCLLIYLMHL